MYKVKTPSVAGTFYPENKEELLSQIADFKKNLKTAGCGLVRLLVLPYALEDKVGVFSREAEVDKVFLLDAFKGLRTVDAVIGEYRRLLFAELRENLREASGGLHQLHSIHEPPAQGLLYERRPNGQASECCSPLPKC